MSEEKWFRMKKGMAYVCTKCQGKDKNLKEGTPFSFTAASAFLAELCIHRSRGNAWELNMADLIG
jgi:hypothetical protein